jgi:prophage DNA circulation protein
MSGFIGTASSVVSGLNSVAGLFGFGSAAPVTLAGVQLTGFATPEKMPFGGAQRLTIHKLPGGARIIDAMGADDRDPSWSGYLMGPAAATMARQLDAIRVAGATVALTWPGFTRQVVVSSFEPDYATGGFVIPYRITCTIVPQPPPSAAAGPSPLTSLLGPSLAGAVTSVTSAVSQVTGMVSAAVGQAQGVLSAIAPIVGLVGGAGLLSKAAGFLASASGLSGTVSSLSGVPATAAQVLTGLTSAASASYGTLSTLGNGMSAITAAAPAGSLVSGATELSQAAAIAGAQAAASQAASQAMLAANATLPFTNGPQPPAQVMTGATLTAIRTATP